MYEESCIYKFKYRPSWLNPEPTDNIERLQYERSAT